MFVDEPEQYRYNVPAVTTAEALKRVLEFVYSGESDIPMEHIEDVYCASVALQIDSLSQQIKKTVLKHNSHWDQLKRKTQNSVKLDPKYKRRKHMYRGFEDNDDFLSGSERSASVHSGQSGDNNNELDSDILKQLIAEEQRLSPFHAKSTEAASIPPIQPLYPVSQPVFPGQEEQMTAEIADNAEDTTNPPAPSSGQPINNSSVFPEPEAVNTSVSDDNDDPSPTHNKDEASSREDRNSTNNDEHIDTDKMNWMPPIVIEPDSNVSMAAYSLYELAQRHNTDSDDSRRYGLTHTTDNSAENGNGTQGGRTWPN